MRLFVMFCLCMHAFYSWGYHDSMIEIFYIMACPTPIPLSYMKGRGA